MPFQLKNATKYKFAFTHGHLNPPKCSLSLIVKATYSIIPDKPIKPAQKQLMIQGDEFVKMDDPHSALKISSDLAPYKPRGEAVLEGSCFAPDQKPAPIVQTRIQIGSVNKTLHVVGNRVWRIGAIPGTARSTEPLPFKAMPINYLVAYGGKNGKPGDEDDEGYKYNPSGRGYITLLDNLRDKETPLPNIEDPAHRIASWEDRPMPAGYGPLNPFWPQRMKKAGTYGHSYVKEKRWPYYPKDFDWSYFNCAPEDQQLSTGAYFQGDEHLVLENLHAKHQKLKTQLPSEHIRMFIVREVPDEKDPKQFKRELIEVKAMLDTVWILPDSDQVALVWRGVAEVSMPAMPEVKEIWINVEPVAAPKSVDKIEKEVNIAALGPAGAAAAKDAAKVEAKKPEKKDKKKDEDKKDQPPPTEEEKRVGKMAHRLEKLFNKLFDQYAIPVIQQAPDDEFEKLMKEHGAVYDKPADDPEFLAVQKKHQDMIEKMKKDAEKTQAELYKKAGTKPPQDIAPIPIEPDEKVKQKLKGAKRKAMSVVRKIQATAKDAQREHEQGRQLDPKKLKGLEVEFDKMMSHMKKMAYSILPKESVDAMMPGQEGQGANRKGDQGQSKKNDDQTAAQAKQKDDSSESQKQGDDQKQQTQKDAPKQTANSRQTQNSADGQSGSSAPGSQSPDKPPAAPDQKQGAAPKAPAAPAVPKQAAAAGGVLGAAIANAKALSKKKEKPPPGVKDKSKQGEGDNKLTREKVIQMHAAKQSLSGMKLDGLDLSALDLSGIDLSSAQCANVNFSQTKLADANMKEIAADNCNFQRAALPGAKLTEAQMSKPNFDGAVMPGADFSKCNINKTSGKKCNFENVDLKNATIIAGQFDGASFVGADLSECALIQSSLNQCDFSKAKLVDTQFVQVSGKNVNMAKANCEKMRANSQCAFPALNMAGNKADRSMWDQCDLTGADFSGAQLFKANFSYANLTNAVMKKAVCKKAFFNGAIMTNVDLTKANLFKASFQYAQIDQSRFANANLFCADLAFSTIAQSFFTDANVKRTILEQK